jgi:hypothetical protein
LLACQKPEDTGTITHNDTTIVVHNNRGGNMLAFMDTRKDFARSGKTIVISGFCASACTIFSTLPNACMAAGSELWFHGGTGPVGAIGTAEMASFYRAGIKEAYLADWKNYSEPLKHVTRAEVMALDPEIRACP